MVELDVPAMVHVSSSCNPNFHATGAHYINADTTAFMQFLTADLFKDFPTLRFIIPHGGGAVPYHWGRYRGLAQDMKRPPLGELIREQRLLRHLRLPSCRDRAAAEDRAGRQYPVRVGDGRRGPRHRPGDGALLRRHEALPRRRDVARLSAGTSRRSSRATRGRSSRGSNEALTRRAASGQVEQRRDQGS